MDSSEGSYGWAPDDPRWTDAAAGGSGRLEPTPPPRFGDAGTRPEPGSATGAPESRAEPEWQVFRAQAGVPAPAGPDWHSPAAVAAAPPVDPGWHALPASMASPASPASVPPALPALPPAVPSTPPVPAVRASARVPVPQPANLRPAPAPPPVHVSVQYTAPPTPAALSERPDREAPQQPGTDATPIGTRLDRQVQVRGRRRSDDEFRRAGRAELFSDDARYGVLYTLTACSYAPVVLVYVGWALFVSDDGWSAAQVAMGLLWIAAACAVSLAVTGLLRWAAVGWRALTLSIASALIGGGVVTIAHTLSG